MKDKVDGVVIPYEVADQITLNSLQSMMEMLKRPPQSTHPVDQMVDQMVIKACAILIEYLSSASTDYFDKHLLDDQIALKRVWDMANNLQDELGLANFRSVIQSLDVLSQIRCAAEAVK